MSGVQESAYASLSEPPASPLAKHLTVPNRVLGDGGGAYTPPISCGCDFAL